MHCCNPRPAGEEIDSEGHEGEPRGQQSGRSTRGSYDGAGRKDRRFQKRPTQQQAQAEEETPKENRPTPSRHRRHFLALTCWSSVSNDFETAAGPYIR